MNERFIERFWAKVNKDGPLWNGTPCWVWTAYRLRGGYGQFGSGPTRWYAHRLAYTLERGSIPDGLTLDHLCRNRPCVNHEHLELVTLDENNARGYGPAAINKRKTACNHGHPYSPENTVIRAHGWRWCRICRRQAGRRARAKLA